MLKQYPLWLWHTLAMGHINLCPMNHHLLDLLNKWPVAWHVILAVCIHQSCP